MTIARGRGARSGRSAPACLRAWRSVGREGADASPPTTRPATTAITAATATARTTRSFCTRAQRIRGFRPPATLQWLWRAGRSASWETPLMRLPSAAGCLVLVLAAAALTAGCGDEQERRVSGTPDLRHAREVERNPYAVTCGDLRRQPLQPDSARLVIDAEFALAREPVLRKQRLKQTLNRTGRSVYYAMSEICKGRDASFEPAKTAVEAVGLGKYRAAKNRPG